MGNKLTKYQMLLTKYMGKVAGNKLLLTLRDTFIMASTPLLIAGFATMLSSVFLSPTGIIFGESGLNIGSLMYGSVETFQSSSFGVALNDLKTIINLFVTGTIAINALFIIVGFAYFGTKRFFPENKEPILPVFYALSSFFIVSPWTVSGTTAEGETATLSGIFNSTYIGQQGIFTGLLVSGITLYIFNKLVRKNITIKMPDSVPPAVARSFESLIPGMITLTFFVITAAIFKSFDTSLPEFLLQMLQKPALAISTTPLFALVAITTQPLLQWFGIHGTSVWGPVFGLTWDINSNENVMRVAEHVYSTMYMNFSVIASGALTIAPILAILIFSRREDNKKIAKLAIAPGIFNISEPVTYGLPIVLNPILLIPYLLSWIVPFFLGTFLTEIHILPVVMNHVPWTVPPVLSGLLYTGSIMGALYQIGVIVLVVFMYMPFVKIANKMNADNVIVENEGED